MEPSNIVETVRQKVQMLCPVMTERMRRHWAASEALTLARGGISIVAQATGLSRTTITAGVRELRAGQTPPAAAREGARRRRPRGGRPLLEEQDTTFSADLE